jgi:hypothetical protein
MTIRTLAWSILVLLKKSSSALLVTFLHEEGREEGGHKLHQAASRERQKPLEGRLLRRFLPGPGGRAPFLPATSSLEPSYLPALEVYLVEMWVPNDVVSALLQVQSTHWAVLGVASSRGREQCPAREGAAGPTRQGSQPRAGAQRGAHGPCADLVQGETKVGVPPS